jgi:hypothetical protein
LRKVFQPNASALDAIAEQSTVLAPVPTGFLQRFNHVDVFQQLAPFLKDLVLSQHPFLRSFSFFASMICRLILRPVAPGSLPEINDPDRHKTTATAITAMSV